MWRLCSFVPSWLQKRPKGLFNISMKAKTLNIQKPNPRSWTVIKCVGPGWLVDTSTSRERNFCIRTLFRVYNSPLERSIQGEQLLTGPKGCHQRHAMATLWPPNCQKMSFRASKRPRKFRTRKTVKTAKLENNCFELGGQVGGYRCPCWTIFLSLILTS